MAVPKGTTVVTARLLEFAFDCHLDVLEMYYISYGTTEGRPM